MLILLRNLGDEYLPKKVSLEKIITPDTKMNYFSIVSFLFIIKDNYKYKSIKRIIELKIKSLFSDGHNDIKDNSEIAHLALDILSCPFVSPELRKYIYIKVTSSLDLARTPTQIDDEYNSFLNVYWFVKWNDLNLINLLERKELKSSYL
ncbi:hypothetical protein J7T07_03145 [Proteus mirabilis]|nr:hypothetical protein [Proteus mirabilis]MBQ0358210.1 hypothetical protein [Proteus mirabilis]